jgi:hypothetical protein
VPSLENPRFITCSTCSLLTAHFAKLLTIFLGACSLHLGPCSAFYDSMTSIRAKLVPTMLVRINSKSMTV